MRKYFIRVLLLIVFSIWNSLVYAQNRSYDFEEASAKQQIKKVRANLKLYANAAYREAYREKYKKNYVDNDDSAEFDMLLGVHYDPEYTIKYLESFSYDDLSMHTLNLQYQLLLLWQIYYPNTVASPDYKLVAQTIHNKVMYYLADKNNWQASWRDEEYAATIGDDFQDCYADLKCLLDTIPYWMGQDIDMDVVIPCNLAQKYNKIWYMDIAGGGSGAQTIMISTCQFDKKYDYPAGLSEYIENLDSENMKYSEGSILFVFYARHIAKSFQNQYRPDFEIEKEIDWTVFPYDEWSIESYYNFRKFNDVINKGIGYKKAVAELTKHYMATFEVDSNKAYNKALEVLKPISSSYYEGILPNNLYYLLLVGDDWSKISKEIPQDVNYGQLLEFSVAYPQNLSKIIEKINQNKNSSVNMVNEFGKTPLMLAAQYGYLDSVKLLLDNLAEIDIQTNDSDCYSENSLLCQHNGKRTALMYAAQEGKYDVLKYLLKSGADITLTDSRGNTAYQYLLGQAPEYKVQPTTMASGACEYNHNPKSAFSEEELKELKPLLSVTGSK